MSVVQWTGVTSSEYKYIVHNAPGTDSEHLLNCVILNLDIQGRHFFLNSCAFILNYIHRVCLCMYVLKGELTS